MIIKAIIRPDIEDAQDFIDVTEIQNAVNQARNFVNESGTALITEGGRTDTHLKLFNQLTKLDGSSEMDDPRLRSYLVLLRHLRKAVERRKESLVHGDMGEDMGREWQIVIPLMDRYIENLDNCRTILQKWLDKLRRAQGGDQCSG